MAILREQSDHVIRADGKIDDGLIDCATVFDGWQDDLAEDKWFAVRGLLDVPSELPWHPPTDYFAHFEADLDRRTSRSSAGGSSTTGSGIRTATSPIRGRRERARLLPW